MTFRWYGQEDPIPLEYIRQIPNCSGAMHVRNIKFEGDQKFYESAPNLTPTPRRTHAKPQIR